MVRTQPIQWSLYNASLLVIISYLTKCLAANQRLLGLNMPDVRPTHDESYLCVSHRLNPLESEFVGKLMRDTPNFVWECGEMNLVSDESEGSNQSPYGSGPVCAPGAKSTILFGWALDAPAIELPPQVGFKIGGGSGIDYLVLQVHYGDTTIFRSSPDITDNSGIALELVSGPNHGITKLAGIYLLLSYGYVPEGRSSHTMECTLSEDKVIHPFRFRTHTHKLGTKVAAYKKSSNSDKPILIGEHNPQEPQMFYPVEEKSLTINRGDRVYAYCDFNNTRNHTVYIGATGNDEMCNFYMMYWTDGGELLEEQDCVQYNPH